MPDIQQYQAQIEISTVKRLGYAYSGIEKKFCFMNY